jgi:methylenetetrahydrofolate reductase (NADPH)
VKAARATGIEVPIIAGIMPITNYEQASRFCNLCEAEIPDDLASAMERLGGDHEAEFELGVAHATEQCTELLRNGVPGIHLYALNRAPAVRTILDSLHAARPWEAAQA